MNQYPRGAEPILDSVEHGLERLGVRYVALKRGAADFRRGLLQHLQAPTEQAACRIPSRQHACRAGPHTGTPAGNHRDLVLQFHDLTEIELVMNPP